MASESSPRPEAGPFLFSQLFSKNFNLFPVSPPQSRSPSPSPAESLTLRSLVSTKDAGVIIGKAGKNVADLREQTGVKAGVSKVIPGVHDRVLTVTGNVEAVAKVSNRALQTFRRLILFFKGIQPHYRATRQLEPQQPSGLYLQRPHFHPPPYLTQSHGNYHWSERPQN